MRVMSLITDYIYSCACADTGEITSFCNIMQIQEMIRCRAYLASS